MLNDIKFLYYLLTNYTLKEIKTLFEISHLIPKMILQKYYENNTTCLHSSKMSTQKDRIREMELAVTQQLLEVGVSDTETLGLLVRKMEVIGKIKKFLKETDELDQKIFVMGNRENPLTYVSDKNHKDNKRVIISSGMLSQWLSGEPPNLPEGKELWLTAGANEDERTDNANSVMNATDITVGIVYPHEELDWILESVSNLNTKIKVVIAFGGSTIHASGVLFNPETGMAESDPDSYMSFPTGSGHEETSSFISQMILECAKEGGLVLIAGSPTIGIPPETWDGFEPNQYGYFDHSQLRRFVKNLGARGKDVIQIFSLIYKELSLPWEDDSERVAS